MTLRTCCTCAMLGTCFSRVALAILVSLALSLTTTPMMCSRLLRSTHERRPGRVFQWSERGFAAVLRGYQRSLAW